MHAGDLVDALGRDLFAQRAIGPTRARTAGELILSPELPRPRGWIYAGDLSMLFIADAPLPGRTTSASAARIMRFDYTGQRRARLSVRPFEPNATIEFADGTVLLGARRQMQAIHELCIGAEY